jgi:hypothetical protein
LNTSLEQPTTLTQLQFIRGILIAIGIMSVLILLALGLQYLHR